MKAPGTLKHWSLILNLPTEHQNVPPLPAVVHTHTARTMPWEAEKLPTSLFRKDCHKVRGVFWWLGHGENRRPKSNFWTFRSISQWCRQGAFSKFGPGVQIACYLVLASDVCKVYPPEICSFPKEDERTRDWQKKYNLLNQNHEKEASKVIWYRCN